MSKIAKVVRFAVDRRGRPIAWQNGYGADTTLWMRIGYEKAKVLVASGQASDVTQLHAHHTGKLRLA